ncbi:MAG: peptide chain release factor 1 [Desulfobacula sp.]|jgi:peptide chain release factor 1|uniref:peptide chain release factor 1 n=1 Tax=Desulfobacula sp. TaxID=2593537 RepID=UPI001E09FCED|nr:peptide chain release factor 1 [Desulfobacula sp.]MBT3484509.1 peptide chain release factor 1 [Desulfobacula sp.]MBT3803147.1 peptide chain release factor 1 [Desulfobacula sp.]MBT4024717.1 peptide chain release factor 1 [Desulfobacula sp.]MBT4197195.1 peptide chain release factor 1 [Desulfobacula sp.]
MIEKLKGIEERYIKLEQLLSDPAVLSDQKKYQAYLIEHGELNKIVPKFREYEGILEELKEAKELLKDDDPEIRAMAKEEIPDLEAKAEEYKSKLNVLLMPKDPRDDKNVLIEIRAGTGGEEAGIFAGDLFRMYSRYTESKNWTMEIIEKNVSSSGGFKEIVTLVKGKGAFSSFKYESGTHRVQRVPETETQGRVHTSAVTVAVLPEAEDVDIDINPADLKIDVFRSSGPGGQSVNTTDSAVRITHIPTGVTATCQDEKSQHKNKAKAMGVLKSRILDAMVREEDAKRAADRKGQVGTGDRSGRIRTYNFPQGRMTDHRIGLTLYRLDNIMEGHIQEIIDELKTYNQAQALKEIA